MTQGDAPSSDIPFCFFETLIKELAKIKPVAAGSSKKVNLVSRSSKAHQTLRNWIDELRRSFSPLPHHTLQTFLEFLFPEEDSEKKYGLKETKLAQYLSDILNISGDGGGESLRTWNSADALGSLGSEVENVMMTRLTNPLDDRNVSMALMRTLLTELAANCPFSSEGVRESFPNPRSQRAILKDIFSRLSPWSACLVTQIILKDLRPLIYPIHETHYSASLLKYNSNAMRVLTKEDVMMAWDPSGRMLKAYKVQGSLSSAAQLFENSQEIIAPRLGVPISIPKCVKGQGCAQALGLLRTSKKVWAETKYDGERAQIHVEIDASGQSRITIFSKSKRDSTLDRFAIHSIIRESLGLANGSQRRDSGQPASVNRPKVSENVVLEAEMVAYSDALDRIDEFWRIRSLITSTAIGPRHVDVPKITSHINDNAELSQYSMLSNASDGGTRHLALVFFDVLMLDSATLLHKPYSERREILESVINIIPRYSMFAERYPIPMSSVRSGPASHLRQIFAQHIADHQEGVVLKADEGKYNQGYLPWVKLKKDYIPGHGDTLDLAILGAVWEKERARELRVSPSVYTTFYLGVFTNPDHQPSELPHFRIIFTASYGLSREALEELNFIIKSSDHIDYTQVHPNKRGSGSTIQRKHVSESLPYTYNMSSSLPPPAVLLCSPILAEVFGAGFTKALRSKFYELRFPRITKIFRRNDRPWTETTTLSRYNEIAREAVGRDRSDKDIEDWCNELWDKPSSPGAKCPEKRKRCEEEWIAKLEIVDRKEKRRRVGKEPEAPQIERSTAPTGIPTRAFGSVTNIRKDSPRDVPLQQDGKEVKESTNPPFLPTPKSSQPKRSRHKSLEIVKPLLYNEVAEPTSKCVIADTLSQDLGEHEHRKSSRTTPPDSEHLHEATTGKRDFLEDAVVWIAKPNDVPRCPPSACSIPTGHRLNTLNALLIACGWTDIETNNVCDWVQKGVIFVDEGSDWKSYPLMRLMDKRSSIVNSLEYPMKRVKTVWILSSRLLDGHHSTWSTTGCLSLCEVEKFAICKFG
ncbi:hypothetical protein NLI96_g5327 [Meripilus lineatus]|uniref:ATP-dependent DNA ligase family profile domain-containing protein n=1 Tax=Meripilus lineatus TaxID=2056292 RepID=A0AAD5V594_9APHY|nr:hypothetical protein NLI96_g5327 [Physisporinus lineatus]